MEECYDPAVRPTTATLCERIQVNQEACIREPSQECITLYWQIKKRDSEIEQLRAENEQNDSIIKQLRTLMSSTRSIPTQELTRVTLGERSTAKD